MLGTICQSLGSPQFRRGVKKQSRVQQRSIKIIYTYMKKISSSEILETPPDNSMADFICCWHLSCSTRDYTWCPVGVPCNPCVSNAMILWIYLPMMQMTWTLGPCWPQGTWESNSWLVFKQVLLAALQTSHWILVNIQGTQRKEEKEKEKGWQSKKTPKSNPCTVFSLPRIMGWKANRIWKTNLNQLIPCPIAAWTILQSEQC